MLTLLAISSISIDPAIAGWQTDALGDSEIAICDITKLDVSKEEMKITLAQAPFLNSTNTTRLDYNVWVETSQLDDTADLTWDSANYEYVCHLTCRWLSDAWINESYIMAHRYYRTADGSAKVEGTFYWNPVSDTWEASNPSLEVAVIIGNTIVWDVTGAIFRAQPLGTGYVVQGISNANYGFSLKDIGPNNNLVDEFDNMCEPPTSSSGTPSLPATGVIISMVFLAVATIGASIIRKRK